MSSIIAFIAGFWAPVLAVCVSILAAAVCAGAETAIVFSNKGHLHELAEKGNKQAKTVLLLVQERDRLHSALLVAENFLIVFAAVVAMVIAAGLITEVHLAAAITVLLMTVLVVCLAKLVPKGIACKNPDRFAMSIASPLYVIMEALTPVTRLLTATADLVAAGPEGASCATVVTEEDIKAMINLGEERGSLKEEEKELLHKVFEFGDTVASEAMRPRTEIISVPSHAALRDVFALVSEFGYSRYPVIEDTVDTVIGTLYIKDILVALASGDVNREAGIEPFIRSAYFIPENKRVSELLSEMQMERFQLAIVIDEYGGTAGLVTLEDLIEEIVGSIHDELESEDKDVQIVDEKNFVVSGQSPLDEVNELLDTNLQSTDFNTLGGFVFGLFGRMPKVGEQLRYRHLKLEVLELEGRKIGKVKITKL
jgi:putative hemolysin